MILQQNGSLAEDIPDLNYIMIGLLADTNARDKVRIVVLKRQRYAGGLVLHQSQDERMHGLKYHISLNVICSHAWRNNLEGVDKRRGLRGFSTDQACPWRYFK